MNESYLLFISCDMKFVLHVQQGHWNVMQIGEMYGMVWEPWNTITKLPG